MNRVKVRVDVLDGFEMRWTANLVYERLLARFPSPAFVMLPQVRNATGFTQRTTRYADAVAISVWPSRGIYATGIEIKVSLSDWRKELADVDKSHAIQQYCRYWYVAAPEGVVPVGEVPDKWGLIECQQKRTLETKPAVKLDAKEPGWGLVASILRSASETTVPRHEVEIIVKDKCEALVMRDSRRLKELQEAVQTFEKAAGIKIDRYDGSRIGEAVQLVLNGGMPSILRSARRLQQEHTQISERLAALVSKAEREGEMDA